jgi:uncharacterized protein YodC (DUF2158 family)
MKNKFKEGDLVELSAAGKKSQQNRALIGGFGFIETIMVSQQAYPIRCKWWKQDMTICNGHFKPYELKFYKNK